MPFTRKKFIIFIITNIKLPVITTTKIRSVSLAPEYLMIPAYVLKIRKVIERINNTKGIIKLKMWEYGFGMEKLNRNKIASIMDTAQVIGWIKKSFHLGVYDLGNRIIIISIKIRFF